MAASASMAAEPAAETLPVASLSDLLDASEDIPSFLNDILAPHTQHDDLSALDRAVSDLLTRLSILGQDNSADLENSIHEISRNVPRLTYDLQFMRESAETVRQSLQTVQHRVKGIDIRDDFDAHARDEDENKVETKAVLDRLAHLDLLKTRMEESRDVLREAESWSTLESETLAFLSNQEYRKAANRLHEASVSILVFQNTPAEFEERRAVLTSLQNALEARLMTRLDDVSREEAASNEATLDAAITERADRPAEVEELGMSDLYRMFTLIEREKEFRAGYFRVRRATLMAAWESTATVESGVSSGLDPPTPTTNLFSTTLHTLFNILSSESLVLARIFPDPLPTLRAFLQTTLEGLNPSLSDRLSQLAEHHGQQAILPLIECWEIVQSFGKSAKALFESMALAAGAGATSPGTAGPPVIPTGRRSRNSSISSIAGVRPVVNDRPPGRRTSRILGEGSMSISGTATFLTQPISSASDPAFQPASISPWEAPLYEPFLDYQSDYEGLEKRYFLYQLRHDSTFARSALLDNDAAKVVLDRDARAVQLATDAISRCVVFTHGYGLAALCAAIDFLLDTTAKESAFVLDVTGSGKSGKAREAMLNDTSMRDELDDLGELDTDDYGPFEAGLKVLQSCRASHAAFLDLSDRLGEQALASKREISQTRSGGASASDSAFTGPRLLLQQSSLNSMELAKLFDSTNGDALLPGSRKALREFTGQAQTTLQRIILAPMYGLLSNYATLPIWNQPEKVQRRGELYVPTFSLSPTDTISQVSERLLNLLRLFEIYTGEEALGFSLDTLPFVDAQALQDLAEAQRGDRNETGRSIPLTSPSLASQPSTSALTATRVSTPTAPVMEFPPEVVVSTWISSLASSLLAHLTRTILPSIKTPLTTPGNAQLASDLGYLSNAIRALDVEWEELESWRSAAEAKSAGPRLA